MLTQIGEKLDAVVEISRKGGVSLKEFLADAKKRWIIQELTDNQFNQCVTARRLGKHRNSLNRDILELKIPVGQLRFDWEQAKRKPVRSLRHVREQQRRA